MEPLDADHSEVECSSFQSMYRRTLIRSASAATGIGLFSGWTDVAEAIARAEESHSLKGDAKSLIFLWMQGGPSQLETFDPHPNTKIGGETKAIETSLPGLQISNLLPRTAEVMHLGTLVRSMVSKEGDHERASYTMKNGWRPDPTLIHPSIGALLCHQSKGNIEIPRHVSILSSQWPARGGYMGAVHDAFLVGDPRDPIANLQSPIDSERVAKRLTDLEQIVEREFRRGRLRDLDETRTMQQSSTNRATKMMASSQIKAFQIKEETQQTQDKFGDTPFGRGCLAAVRLVEQGVRCVEVELSGWDTHAKNHLLHSGRCEILDAALHGLVTELQNRGLLDSTILVCGGEFGRTPQINIADGRDHWTTGFSTVVFGGPFRRGFVYGETSSEAVKQDEDPFLRVKNPVPIEDLHATLLSTFGVEISRELQTPIGRPLVLSQGTVRTDLLTS